MLISIPSMQLDEGYRLDLLVDDSVIIKIKAVEKLMPVHPNRSRIFRCRTKSTTVTDTSPQRKGSRSALACVPPQ
jgi:hypothetical protein